MAEFLVKRGANVNNADVRGRTPLMLAAIRGMCKTFCMLQTMGADINSIDNEGLSWFCVCVRKKMDMNRAQN